MVNLMLLGAVTANTATTVGTQRRPKRFQSPQLNGWIEAAPSIGCMYE